jgi:predicted RNase H-like nuclease (RuvC/YqgF family)
MSKRQATTLPEDIPRAKMAKSAAVKVKENRDVMDLVIMSVKYSNDNLAKEVGELKESNAYLHRQVERLDRYTEELEARLGSMEDLVARMLADGSHTVVEAHVHAMREELNHDMTDLDRLLAEYETEEETDWFDEIFN